MSTPTTLGLARTNVEERTGEGEEGRKKVSKYIQRVKLLIPTRSVNALKEDEEEMGKEKKKKEGGGLQPSYPVPFGHHLLPTCICSSVI